MATFAARLKKARAARALTINALADKLGTYSTNVSAWEHGRSRPGLRKLVQLGDTLRVSLDWLAGRTEGGGP